MPESKRRVAVQGLVLVLLAALAYWPGLSGGFLFDDFPNIVHEPAVHAEELTAESLATAARTYHGSLGRPVATVSFAVDYSIWGMNPLGFKRTNLAVHLVNTLLVFLLVLRLLPLAPVTRSWGSGPAFVIATLWAIHPLQVSTVLYVVQRMEMLSLTFVLLALLAYLHGRLLQIEGRPGWHWLVASLPLCLLGFLSKENALLFPVYTLALELTLLGFRAHADASSKVWRIAYATGVGLALLLFVFVVLPRFGGDAAYAIRDFDTSERLLTQLRILPTYLGWILLPQPASYVFYYDNVVASQGWLQPASTLMGGILLAALAALALAFRRRTPLLSLGILWFFGAHLITSNVLRLELVFEHRNYFAILGVLLAASELVARLPASRIPRIRSLAAGALITSFLALTLIRSATWGDELNLAMELAAKNPSSSRASMDLGELYLQLAKDDASSPLYAKGMKELERGAGLPNSSPMPEQGLIVYSAAARQQDKAEWWDRLILKLRTRAIGPQELGMMVDLLRMRHEGIRFNDDRFAEAYAVVVERVDLPPVQLYAFGEHALKFLKDDALAAQLFHLAADKSGDNPDFAAAMVELLARDGYKAQAQELAAYIRSIGLADIRLNEAESPPAPVETED